MPPRGYRKPKPIELTIEDYQDAVYFAEVARQSVRMLERRFPMNRAVIGLEGSADAAIREFTRLRDEFIARGQADQRPSTTSVSPLPPDADRPGETRS